MARNLNASRSRRGSMTSRVQRRYPCLSLLTAVCLAWPPGVVKAAEPEPASAEPEPASAEPEPLPPNPAPLAPPNPAPLVVPNPAPHLPPNPAPLAPPDPAPDAAPDGGYPSLDPTAPSTRPLSPDTLPPDSLPKWPGDALLAAGITTAALGVVPTVVYAVYPNNPRTAAPPFTPGPSDPDAWLGGPEGVEYYAASPIDLAAGISMLAAGAAMTTVGAVRRARYREALDAAIARGPTTAAPTPASLGVPVSRRTGAPRSGKGLLYTGIGLLAAGGVAYVWYYANASTGNLGWQEYGGFDIFPAAEREWGALIFLPWALLGVGAGIPLVAIGATRRARYHAWQGLRSPAPDTTPTPTFSLHGGAVAPMSIRPGVAYGRPVRTYGFQVRF